MVPEGKFDIEILESHKLTAVELFKFNLVECLIKSIPIKEAFKDMDVKYRKMEVKDDSLLEKYDIKELPCLLFFKDGKLIDKIEGYYDVEKKDEFIKKVKEIVSKAS